ncbi:pyridoxamine 5'-phosphate oxidase family protein [Novosphingobium mangrovi (ex Huang et al. 2023)]|uniref:Pyridoxamine 5'-phosphate oxidase family protein n=1 Tax=Novosphingobium mangrovi (ex Huang et al. 2023) TaxID=2976432 RepID=A0ABT2I9X0_9SPHN|nr:pyridoxamine 5'-phosphate oxidase family protein [Novosphingobium mangrovi (ex Huang et al. 2023)]MCT2401569.1 pyridoxamine 5'-phosphate oxidase family protein [Novosphingobium mangrovi (ex Huang et al. 2023)]
MPSRRDMVRMTPEETRAYQGGERRIILVTNGPEGLPHPVPMNYGLDDEGRVLITSFARSQKVCNLERDPRAALLVESGETYAELKAVILYADVEIVRGPEQVVALMRRIRAAEPLAGSLDAAMSEQVRASIAKRVVLRFTPFRAVSWDHGKLGGKY